MEYIEFKKLDNFIEFLNFIKNNINNENKSKNYDLEISITYSEKLILKVIGRNIEYKIDRIEDEKLKFMKDILLKYEMGYRFDIKNKLYLYKHFRFDIKSFIKIFKNYKFNLSKDKFFLDKEGGIIFNKKSINF